MDINNSHNDMWLQKSQANDYEKWAHSAATMSCYNEKKQTQHQRKWVEFVASDTKLIFFFY